MLSNLVIKNIAVIELAEIDFNFGLNVFTGETGAGKSIIIDSIHAVLGERTSRDLIRTGAESAFVSALFTGVCKRAKELLASLGFECEDDTVLLQRRMTADGKNVCRINGMPATLSIMREVAPLLINIHGQHDEQELLNPASHCGFIDSFGMLEKSKERYVECYKKLKELRKKIKSLSTDEAEKNKRMELLKYQISELEEANIRPGEREELSARAKQYANSEKIISKLGLAYENMNGDNGALQLLSNALSAISDVASSSKEIENILSELSELYYGIQNCGDEVRNLFSSLDFSKADMDNIEDRLDFLSALSRKYGATEQDMLDYYAKAVSELENLDSSQESLDALNAEYEVLRSKTEELAHILSADRNGSAKLMCKKIKEELQFLDMPNVDFCVSNNTGNFTVDGIDNIEFLVSTNAGETPKPLCKIASGGELSRIMLAIKNVLAEHGGVDTLIFDEIDAGISGRAAQKVGLKLHQLAGECQVICVTHLSHIAAQADCHLLIEKSVHDSRTYTTVKALDFEGRKMELARILGGMNITELMLKNAEEILHSYNKQEG